MLHQAGSSVTDRAFGARIAEAVFAGASSLEEFAANIPHIPLRARCDAATSAGHEPGVDGINLRQFLTPAILKAFIGHERLRDENPAREYRSGANLAT